MSKKIIISNNTTVPAHIFMEMDPEKTRQEYVTNDQNLFSIRETFILTAPSSIKSIDEWRSYIGSLFQEGTSYLNHNTALTLPKDQVFFADKEDVKGVSFFNCSPIVNYQEAHKYLNFVSVRDERDLTCFYTSFKNYSNKHLMEYQSFKDGKTNKQSFVSFDENYNNIFIGRSPNQLNKMSNVLFGHDFNLALNNKHKQEFPIHTDISFSTVNKVEQENTNGNDIDKKRGMFGPILNEVKVYESFVNDYIASPKTFVNFQALTLDSTDATASYPSVDLIDIISRFSYRFDESDKIIISDDLEKDNKYSMNLKKLMCLGKLRSISKTKTRGFMDLIEQKPSQYEFLFYKIEKHVGAVSSVAPISSFWVSSKEEVVNITDTQVKANQDYTYVVKGYMLLYGSNYSVTGTDFTQGKENLTCTLTLTTDPSYQVLEVPLFQKRVKFNMKPQLPPYVEFINESNASNRIKIFLNLQKGNILSEFLTINQTDDQRLLNMTPMTGPTEIYNFIYTPEVPTFEVFRTDIKPIGYEDFSTISPMSIYSNYDSTSIVHYDRVLPNKKYYYMFRVVSNYNLVSNPTAIYEVELLKDADDSKVVVNLIQLKQQDISQGSKFLRRLLKISPAAQHTVFDETDGYRDNLDKVRYGVAEDGIWGKKFKLRLKSKDSGKKIDFNILFKLVRTKSTEDFS